jgi:PleD family two-component response regulator
LHGIAFVIRRLGSEFSEWAEAGMRSKYDHIKVEVENSSESGMRTYRITLKASEKDFELTDQLTQIKVIDSFDRRLRQALRNATKSYLNSAESLLSALAKKPRQTVQHGTNELETSGARLIRLRSLKLPTK